MSSTDPAERTGLSARQIVGIAIALVSFVLIAANWGETEVSLVFVQMTIPLAVLLALVCVGGMATGALVLRRRQTRGN